MATLQTVVDRITRDHLNRTTLDNEAIRAVQAAVRHYERERYTWNETATALACVVSQTYITVPTDLMILDVLQITAFGSTNDLIEESFDEILQMNAVLTNTLPTHFAQRGDRFYIAGPADSAYAVPCYYLQKLAPLTATLMTSSNGWLDNAEDLIVHHATKLLWANVLRNTEEAQKFYALEKTAYNELAQYRDQRTRGRLRPTRF